MGNCRHHRGGQVEIVAELIHELDADGKQLSGKGYFSSFN